MSKPFAGSRAEAAALQKHGLERAARAARLPPRAITGLQCKSARNWLGLTIEDLADIVGISISTISKFETGAGKPKAITRSWIEQAMTCKWVEFIEGGLVLRPVPEAQKRKRKPS